MVGHDERRRTFLIGAAITTAAGAALVPDAYAREERKSNAVAAPEHAHATGTGFGVFFSSGDAVTIAAMSERLMPGAPGEPGARDAGVLNYIDLALAGAYSDLQDFYRSGLAALDDHCRKIHSKPFAQLTAAEQDEVITAMAEGNASGFTWPTSQAFFNTVRTHTMEGMFADPIYGGNKDYAGWRLVGFPGAQPIFSEADMQSRQRFSGAVITGLQGPARRS